MNKKKILKVALIFAVLVSISVSVFAERKIFVV